MTNLSAYSSVYALGHRMADALRNVDVNVEEKIDGSQFSFGNIDGELLTRSRGAQFHPEAPPDLFKGATETAMRLFASGRLPNGMIVRGEALQKPRHNAMEYDRVPAGHVIVFDIETNPGNPALYPDKLRLAAELGLEVVPLLAERVRLSDLKLDDLLAKTSILGTQRIEGVVIKPANCDVFGPDKKMIMAKYVSEAFKEIADAAWKRGGDHRNHTQNDILQQLGAKYGTEARWMKAIQHFSESGRLDGSPKDIGMLIKEVPEDILTECIDEVKADLFAWAIRDLRRAWTKGFPEFYKRLLAEKVLNKE